MAQVEVQDDVEFVLKHRIVGAVILILFAVFVLPFILRGQDVNGTSKPTTIRTLSEPDPAAFVSKVIPVEADQEAVQPSAAGSEKTVGDLLNGNGESKPVDINTRSQPAPNVSEVATDAKKSTTKESTKSEKKVAIIDRGWVVQVATFGSVKNANKMKNKLEENGFSVRTSKIDTTNGQATRIWVGPFEQRVTAGRARADIERVIGQKGLIMAYP